MKQVCSLSLLSLDGILTEHTHSHKRTLVLVFMQKKIGESQQNLLMQVGVRSITRSKGAQVLHEYSVTRMSGRGVRRHADSRANSMTRLPLPSHPWLYAARARVVSPNDKSQGGLEGMEGAADEARVCIRQNMQFPANKGIATPQACLLS